MKILYLVEVTIAPIEYQSKKEFELSDGQDMIPYVTDKIHDALSESWQHNAIVRKVKISHPNHKPLNHANRIRNRS